MQEKTKEADLTKIGKFGLGFCSVYNITDVPSFVSGNSMVILDPHATHLNKAIKNKSSPGVRIKFSDKNLKFLKKLKKQLMPFNGVFGCDLSGTGGRPPNVEGTLFRLPLRTKNQAIDGKISNRPYSKKEMMQLLKIFAHSVGSLLIFTQNIAEIEVYHLPPTSDDPDKAELLFKASREEESGTRKRNILRRITESNLRTMSPGSLDQVIQMSIYVKTTQQAFQQLEISTTIICF